MKVGEQRAKWRHTPQNNDNATQKYVQFVDHHIFTLKHHTDSRLTGLFQTPHNHFVHNLQIYV